MGLLFLFLTATTLLSAAFTIPLLFSKIVRWKSSTSCGCLPPALVARKDPMFGLDILVPLLRSLEKNTRNESIRQLFQTYGYTFQVKSWSGSKFFTIEPRNLQAIFATDFASWGVEPMRLFAFEPFIGKGIMCVDGADWELSRALIKPTFARVQIADLHLEAYSKHVDILLDLLPTDGGTVDLQPLFGSLALDASTDFLFGDSVGSLSPETQSRGAHDFLEAYNYGQMIVGRRLQLPSWNFLTVDDRFRKACSVAHQFVDEYIAKSREIVKVGETRYGGSQEKPRRYVLAQELIKETKDESMVRNQLLNVFLPAHEAAGVALTNIFFHLARHPKTYARLRRAIEDAERLALGANIWTFEGLKAIKYLQYVINETFRLNPAIGTNARKALRDTILPTGGGPPYGFGSSPIHIRKGDTVSTSFYALHRRPDLFGEDASHFRPERWETLRPKPWTYQTFGGGPRHCPGQQLALMEVAFTTAKIVKRFQSIENRDPVMEFVEDYKITTQSRNGAKVSLVAA